MHRWLRIAPTICGLLAAGSLVAQDTSGWTGFYGGVQFGAVDATGQGGLSDAEGDESALGLHAGYNHSLGDWVLGAEIDYDFTNTDLETAGIAVTDLDNVARLKLRAGYALGQALIYATAGPARADTSLGNETGEFYGVGVAYEISNRFVISGEYLTHDFSDIGGGVGNDIDADTITLRFSLRF
ncbi:MAG: porin family protein [Pseudomonadota bacterium]